MVDLVLEDAAQEPTDTKLKLFAANVLESDQRFCWTLHKAQFLVVADAAFPGSGHLSRHLNNLRVDEALEGLVLVRSIPILTLAHDKERSVSETYLRARDRHSFLRPKTPDCAQLVLTQVDALKH